MREENKWIMRKKISQNRMDMIIFNAEQEKRRKAGPSRGLRSIFCDDYLKGSNTSTTEEAVERFVKDYPAFEDEKGREAVTQWAQEILSKYDRDER